MLVSRLKTKFLHPSSSAFATPRPRVESLLSFFPFLTTTSRSASKSNANPISASLDFDTSSSSGSDVGSGPLELFSRSLLIVITIHPIFCSNDEAIFFAEPPPISTITLGLPGIFSIIFAASST